MCAGRITAVLDNADATQEKIMHYATHFSLEDAGRAQASSEGTVTT